MAAIIQDTCIIIICKCGHTNHDHRTGICPDGNFWFENIDSAEEREPFNLAQSHGGHYWIPFCEHVAPLLPLPNLATHISMIAAVSLWPARSTQTRFWSISSRVTTCTLLGGGKLSQTT